MLCLLLVMLVSVCSVMMGQLVCMMHDSLLMALGLQLWTLKAAFHSLGLGKTTTTRRYCTTHDYLLGLCAC